MASVFRSFRRVCICLGFLTSLSAQSLALFTDDPEWFRLVLDSVAAGSAKFQMKTGTEMPFSQRINCRLSPFVTIRTYSRAGLDKSNETGNVTFELFGFSITTGPVLISHACGFVTGRATSRQRLHPGSIKPASYYNVRLTPVLSSPFTGFGTIKFENFSATVFTTETNPGFMMGWAVSRFSLSIHYSPDHWLESLAQIQIRKLRIRINGSLASDLSQPGHAFVEIVLNNRKSGLKLISYAMSERFNPLYGKNPWFGGTPFACAGGGGGLMIKPVTNMTINASILQQDSRNNTNVAMEFSVSGKLSQSCKSETLLLYDYHQFLAAEKIRPYLYAYQTQKRFTVKQAFHFAINKVFILQTSWSAAYNKDSPSTTGAVLLQYKTKHMLLKIQSSQISGGTADLWYVRPIAGTDISIHKASKGSFSFLDIAGEIKIQNLALASGLSYNKNSFTAVVQIKFALNSMNR